MGRERRGFHWSLSSEHFSFGIAIRSGQKAAEFPLSSKAMGNGEVFRSCGSKESFRLDEVGLRMEC